MTDPVRAFVGIDPGASGALVMIGEDASIIIIEPMPMRRTLVSGRARRVLDEWGLARLVDDWASRYWLVRAAIERQQAWGGGDRPMTVASLVGNYRSLRMALIAHMILVDDVTTRAWRKAAGLPVAEKDRSARKSQSIARASDLWPDQAASFGGRDGAAEAALIARWCLHHGGR